MTKDEALECLSMAEDELINVNERLSVYDHYACYLIHKALVLIGDAMIALEERGMR